MNRAFNDDLLWRPDPQQYPSFSFNHELTEEINTWRKNNHNRFATKEIFREEFLWFVDWLLSRDYKEQVNRLFNRNRHDIEEFKKETKTKLDDMRNQTHALNRWLSDLISIVSLLKKDLSPKKKK